VSGTKEKLSLDISTFLKITRINKKEKADK